MVHQVVSLLGELDTTINVGNLTAVAMVAAAVIGGLFKVLRKQDEHGGDIKDVKVEQSRQGIRLEKVETATQEMKLEARETNTNLQVVVRDVAEHKERLRTLESAKG